MTIVLPTYPNLHCLQQCYTQYKIMVTLGNTSTPVVYYYAVGYMLTTPVVKHRSNLSNIPQTGHSHWWRSCSNTCCSAIYTMALASSLRLWHPDPVHSYTPLDRNITSEALTIVSHQKRTICNVCKLDPLYHLLHWLGSGTDHDKVAMLYILCASCLLQMVRGRNAVWHCSLKCESFLGLEMHLGKTRWNWNTWKAGGLKQFITQEFSWPWKNKAGIENNVEALGRVLV
jgi:hypothetical protein